jgi:3-oxo-5-alpha-steroid 4-dehydrogenase 3
MSLLAAPRGMLVNKTMFAGFILTVVNLGVSAGISKEWYARKFGRDKVQHKWKMIPWLY